MIIARPGESHPFVPITEERKPEGKRVRYHLRVPTVWDRIPWRRALGARGARNHGVIQQLDVLADGIRAIYGEKESPAKARLIETVAELRSETLSLGQRLADGELSTESEEGRAEFQASLERQAALHAALAEAADVVATGYEPFARMRADLEAYPLIRGLEAARLFVVGWDNGPCPFERTDAGLPDDVLARIPEAHLLELGAEVERMMAPAETESKNSASPSRTGSRQRRSTAASTRSRARSVPATSGGPSPSSASESSGSIRATS